jgi:hypothetical protein
MRFWIVGILLFCITEIRAQVDTTFQFSLSTKVLLSNSSTTPFWLTHNKFGVYEGDQNELIIQADVEKEFHFGNKISLEIGGNLVGKNQFDKSYIHEVYANLSYGNLKLLLGKEEITYTQYSENLGTGSYYFSNNARPIPRLGIGFYDFTDLPFTNGYVQIKGFLNQGILLDDRGNTGTDNPLFHEKIVYLRSNKLPFNIHVGLNHSALFGGTLPNGTEIPVDYWSTFFGKGSAKIGGGEASNAAGAHSGLFDFGFNTKIKNADFLVYVQKPFTDRSGFTRFFENNKDHIAGLIFQSNSENSFITEIIYENISLLWQSGEGLFDPVINGNVYFGPKLDDKDKIMWEEYGIETDGISDAEFWRFVTRKENYGFKYGGRDNYYNNGLYKRGWSNWSKALGNPLLLTDDRIKSINPDFDSTYDLYFVSTRVFAHHLGVSGRFRRIDFRAQFTYTKNYGTYRGLNRGNDNWDSKDAYSDYYYYFEHGLYEIYSLIALSYTIPSIPDLTLNLELGADFGEMYNSFGAILGLRYQPF